MRFVSLLLLLPALLGPAARPPDPPLFTRLAPEATGLVFVNRVEETDSLNVFRYEYLYNGAGVGVGDFNGDGRPDVFFSGNAVPNKLFLNEGGLRFRDVTAASGVGGNGTWATGVSVADVNGDGRLDVYVGHSGKFPPEQLANELFINEGTEGGLPRFRERAAEFGLDLPGTQTTQAAFFDHDRDGDLDCFVLNHSNHSVNPFVNTRKTRATPDARFGNRLLRNDGGRFVDETREAGIVNNALNFGLGVVVSDFNADGWPDLYATSDYTEQDGLYVNQRNGRFRESLREAVGHVSKFSMGCDAADVNADGLPDLVTLDMLPPDNHRQKLLKGPDEYDAYRLLVDSGYFPQQMRNMLQLNQGGRGGEGGGGRRGGEGEGKVGDGDSPSSLSSPSSPSIPHFSEIGQLAGIAATDWSWAALLADYDLDGRTDLFVSNGYLRDFTDLDFMKYTVAEARLEAASRGKLDFQTTDLVRKMPANQLRSFAFRNQGTSAAGGWGVTFADVSAPWGLDDPAVSGASAYADFDGDGDLDLLVCRQNAPAALYRNNAETRRAAAHFLRVHLVGEGGNTAALGARVVLESAAGRQVREVYPVRGYQASVETPITFGLGTDAAPARLTVYWPDGRLTRLPNPGSDRLLTLRQAEATERGAFTRPDAPPLFSPLPAGALPPFRHRENDFVDFKVEVLIPYQLSRLGPALAKADVNGDGLDDVFVGGAIGQSGGLFFGDKNGAFQPAPTQPWSAHAASEDANALFFDADGDGDADLYVVSGGNEYEDGAPEYQDRLYLNDGHGGLKSAATTALPTMRSAKMALAAADFDGDGDLDLFVGGRGRPGFFPQSSDSYLLRNESVPGGAVRFTDATDALAPGLRRAGMVQAAAWADLDGDRRPDLALAGDWMPLKLFNNQAGALRETHPAGLAGASGLWASLLATDWDGDGDVDLLAGNAGLNNPFRASATEPMTLTAGDVDDDGVPDPVWCYFIQGKSHPVPSRDELLDQVAPLRKKFTRYRAYADATLDDIYPPPQRARALTLAVTELASGWFRNDGRAGFRFEAFPLEAQFSRASALLPGDFDGDGHADLLVAGNFYPYRVQSGPGDASFGCLLRGDGRGRFAPVPPRQSGIWASGDVRGAVALRTASGRTRLLFAVNDGPLLGFER